MPKLFAVSITSSLKFLPRSKIGFPGAESYGNRDERPAFVLQDVENAGFIRPQVPVATGVPVFALSEVEHSRLRDSTRLPDMSLDRVAQKEILAE